MKKILLWFMALFVTVSICYFVSPTSFIFFKANYGIPHECFDGDCYWDFLRDSFNGDSAMLFPCSTPKEKLISTPEECAKCPNREMIGNVCVKKCEPGYLRMNTSCVKPCPIGTFRGDEWANNGKCYSCDEMWGIKANSESECQKCPNREYKQVALGFPYSAYTYLCVLKTCPPQSIRTLNGACWTCESDNIGPTTQEECAKCPHHKYQYGEEAILNDSEVIRMEGGSCWKH